MVSVRSVAVTPGRSSPESFTPTTCGVSMKSGWPSITASASMPPTPQPTTPRPLIMVVCESVPTRVSGKATAPSASLPVRTTVARRSTLTWWTMPMPGGTAVKSWKAFCPHFKNW